MKTNKHKFKKAITNCLKAVWVICFLLTGSSNALSIPTNVLQRKMKKQKSHT